MARYLLPLVITIVATALAMPVSAEDDPTTDAFAVVGLLGTWSPDCSRPPSPTNPRVAFVAGRHGFVRHQVVFRGRTVAVSDIASDGQILSDDLVRFSISRGGQLYRVITVRVGGNHMQIESATDPLGQPTFADGIDLETGRPAIVDERCDQATS